MEDGGYFFVEGALVDELVYVVPDYFGVGEFPDAGATGGVFV